MPSRIPGAAGVAVLATLPYVAMEPSAARACTGPCPRLFAVTQGEHAVAEGGVALLHCSDCPQMPQPLEAVDASGTAHAGALDELARERPSWPLTPRTYYAWRPAEPLAAGVYRLRAVDPAQDDQDPCTLATFEVEIHVPEAATLDALPAPVLTLGTANRPAGTVFGCRDRCDPARLGTRAQEAPYLEHQVATGDDHPARARYLVRLVADTENGALEEGPWWSLGAVTGPTVKEDGVFVAEDVQHGGVTFPLPQNEYCARLELLDIVNGSRPTVEAGCVQHDLPEERLATVPSFGTCDGFVDATKEEYLDAFCGDNAQDCAGGDWRCDEWRKQCTTPPDPPDASTATPEDASAAMPEDASMATPGDAEQPAPAQSKDAGSETGAPEDEGVSDAGSGSDLAPPPDPGACNVGGAAGTGASSWPLLLLAAWPVRRVRRRGR